MHHHHSSFLIPYTIHLTRVVKISHLREKKAEAIKMSNAGGANRTKQGHVWCVYGKGRADNEKRGAYADDGGW